MNFYSNNYMPVVFVLIIFDVVLKGITLWKAARSGSKVWFVALLLINSGGLLPIIYLLLNRNKSQQPKL